MRVRLRTETGWVAALRVEALPAPEKGGSVFRPGMDTGMLTLSASVAREGELAAGDVIERIARDDRVLTVADLARLYTGDSASPALLELASQHPALPASWRDYFGKRLRAPDA